MNGVEAGHDEVAGREHVSVDHWVWGMDTTRNPGDSVSTCRIEYGLNLVAVVVAAGFTLSPCCFVSVQFDFTLSQTFTIGSNCCRKLWKDSPTSADRGLQGIVGRLHRGSLAFITFSSHCGRERLEVADPAFLLLDTTSRSEPDR